MLEFDRGNLCHGGFSFLNQAGAPKHGRPGMWACSNMPGSSWSAIIIIIIIIIITLSKCFDRMPGFDRSHQLQVEFYILFFWT